MAHSLQFAQRGDERQGEIRLKFVLDPAGRVQGKLSDKTNTLCGLSPAQLQTVLLLHCRHCWDGFYGMQ